MIPSLAAIVDSIRELDLAEDDTLVTRIERLGGRATPEELLIDLVNEKIITPFQASYLNAGQGNRLMLGGYRLIEQIGEGGMGQVFKASQVRLNRYVALKVIAPHLIGDEQAFRRFQREAQAAAMLRHPNIVVIHDFDHADETWFLVMEFVEGIDLAKLVKSRSGLGIREACIYMRQAADGLNHAHEAGLIHRDVKPHNLLLTYPKEAASRSGGGILNATMLRTINDKPKLGRSPEDALIKILDLGLARFQTGKDDVSFSTLTKTNALLGTPDFVSPEQAREAHNVDGRADIYSLGCTFYYLLAGHAPYSNKSVVDKLIAHQSGTAPPLETIRPNIPTAVTNIISKMMACKPNDRYQRASEIVSALDDFLRGPNVIAPTADVQPPTPATMMSSAGTPLARTDFPVPDAETPSAMQTPPEIVQPAERTHMTRMEAPSINSVMTTDNSMLSSGYHARRLAQFEGHRGHITALEFSDDGKFLASCGTDDYVRVWNLQTSPFSQVATGNGEPLRDLSCIAFAPGGMQLAIGSSLPSGQIVMWAWTAPRGRNYRIIQADMAATESLHYSNDCTMLIAGVGGNVWVWRIRDAEARVRATLRGHRGNVRTVAFSPREGYVASGGEDGTLRLWQLGRIWSGEKTAIVAHRGPLERIVWSPNGGAILSGGIDQKVRVWDCTVESKDSLRSIGKMDGVVRRVQWVSNGRGAIAIADRGEAAWWPDLDGTSSPVVWNLDLGLITSQAITPDGVVALGTSDGNIHIFQLPLK